MSVILNGFVDEDVPPSGPAEAEQRAFDRMTRLCSRLLSAPVAIMSLVDPDAHFFRSECDLSDMWTTLRSAPALYSFGRDVAAAGPVAVRDCRDPEGPESDRAIAELGVVAYAAVPLHDFEGRLAGSFVALDTSPHDWAAEDVQTLADLALLVMTADELRRTRTLARTQSDAIRQSELLMRQVIETAPDAFLSVDPAGGITEWNPAAQRMFGWSRSEVIGHTVTELIVPLEHRPDHALRLSDCLQATASSPESTVMETSALHRDGTELAVEISIAGLKTLDGWAYNAFLHDISDRHRAEQMTDESLALVSHELRTQLSSIVAHVELLLDEDELSEPIRRRFLDVISRSSVRLQRLAGDLLFVAQLQSTDLSLSRRAIDIVQVASQAVEGAQPRVANEGLKLILDAEPVGLVFGDRDRLGQALDNLVANAINYSLDGTIVVRVRRHPDGVLIEVEDEGIGIPDDEQTQVFKRFFRASTATDLHVSGVGLGLVIVKRIVEGHGGEIWLTTELSAGTTFSLTLPVTADGLNPPE